MLPGNTLIPQVVLPLTVLIKVWFPVFIWTLESSHFCSSYFPAFSLISLKRKKQASSCVGAWLLARANLPHLKWKEDEWIQQQIAFIDYH